MKIGIVPATAIAESPDTRLDASYYLTPGDRRTLARRNRERAERLLLEARELEIQAAACDPAAAIPCPDPPEETP